MSEPELSNPPPRSWLYIPADSDKKLGKADASGADAVVLDLEDSVAPENRPDARRKVRAFLKARPPHERAYQIWVRINPLDGDALADLAAIMDAIPDGVVQPKIDGPTDINRLEHYLEAFEAAFGIPGGHTRIVAVANETPAAALHLPEFGRAKFTRLLGLNWGAEDLSAELGAADKLGEDGQLSLTYRVLHGQILLAARAAGVQPIETVFVNFRDPEGLYLDSRASARQGFTGRAAIHPDQVEPINRAYAPSPEDIDLARKVVEAFSKIGGVGTVGINGKMYDIPHLKRAQRLLALHEAYSQA